MGSFYYNEFDKHAAAWLRELGARGFVPAGTVDQRSICDVDAGELAGFQQCHFFAGIAGWPLALQLAGWPAGWRVWTGSCPCQPFSVAGKKKGKEDERHLWPVWFRLIAACRPECIFGEQVASPDARDWLDGVQTDMEGIGYTFGAVVLGAHSAGADHGRQRIYWMAIAPGERFQTGLSGMHGDQREAEPSGAEAGAVADSGRECGERRGITGELAGESGAPQGEARERERCRDADSNSCAVGAVADSIGPRLEGHAGDGDDRNQSGRFGAIPDGPVAEAGFWSGSYPLHCLDGNWRRVPTDPALYPIVEPSVFTVDDGVSGRVGGRRSVRSPLLRAAGNAIVPQIAAEFIKAGIEWIKQTQPDQPHQ